MNRQTKYQKIPLITKLMLSILIIVTISFASFLIVSSKKSINNIFLIVNALLLIIIVFSYVISFKKAYKDNKTLSFTFSSLIIVLTLIFDLLYLNGIINLPKQSYLKDYTNMSLDKALEYTDKNHLDTDLIYDYSDNVEKYHIINQSVKANTLTKDIKNITFNISNGPDYNKEVILPNMESWNIDEAVSEIDRDLLNNVEVNYIENEDIERDEIISQSKYGNIKRNDKIVLEVSLEKISDLKPIKLKDLTNLSEFKSTLYLKRNNISYDIIYEFSNSIKKGNVISYNKKRGQTINPGDKISLTISKGKKIKAIDLTNMKFNDVLKWLMQNNLKINYQDSYNNKIKKNRVISSNIKKGDILEEDSIVDINVSKGKLKLKSFKSLDEFKAWASRYNIKYEIKEEYDNSSNKGEIIRFSIKEGKYINLDEKLIVYVSKGQKITVPDFTNKTKEEAQNECNNLKLVCKFYNSLSDKKEGLIIKQNINAGSDASEGDTIELDVSVKDEKQVTPSNKIDNNSNNNSNNSSNNRNNSTRNNNTNSTRSNTRSNSNNSSNQSNNSNNKPTCSVIGKFYVSAGDTGDQTRSMISSINNGANISYNFVSKCSNGNSARGTVCSTSISEGTSYTNCDKISVTIVK